MEWSVRDKETGQFVKTVTGFCSVGGCRSFVFCKGLCKKHYHASYMQEYRARNPEKRNMYWAKHKEKIKARNNKHKDELNRKSREWRRALKVEVMTHYSNGKPRCAKCGFDDIRALCIDHVNNDGAYQRRMISHTKGKAGNGVAVLVAAKRDGYPNDLQVLCSNCNRIKEYEVKELVYGKS